MNIFIHVFSLAGAMQNYRKEGSEISTFERKRRKQIVD